MNDLLNDDLYGNLFHVRVISHKRHYSKDFEEDSVEIEFLDGYLEGQSFEIQLEKGGTIV